MAELTDAQKKIQEYITSFDEIDKSGDGSLSISEVHRFLREKHGFSTPNVYNLFKEADENRDYYVSREEFGAQMKTVTEPKTRENQYRLAFKKLDKDGSNTVTFQEIVNITNKDLMGDLIPEDKVHQAFIGVIRDDDGKVDIDEFLKILSFGTTGK